MWCDMMDLFDPGKKMLMQGDFDLNSVQRHADSFKGVIKQTILKQEVIFRTQVLTATLHHDKFLAKSGIIWFL